MNDVVLSVIRIRQALLSHTFLKSLWIPCPTKTHVICDAFKKYTSPSGRTWANWNRNKDSFHIAYTILRQLKALTASESTYNKPHFWTRRPSATARPGFTKSNMLPPLKQGQWVGHASMYAVQSVKLLLHNFACDLPMQKIFSTESSSAANKGQHTEHIEHDWTCQYFQIGKAC